MATQSKYITLAKDILLEYVYDDDNLKKEDYHIIKNLNIDETGYCSTIGNNLLKNQVFPIDPILNKYAKVNTSKYNFLKTTKHDSQYIHYDTVRLHLPTTFSFIDNNYIGLYLKIYVYDYINKKTINLASYLYDDTEVGADKNIRFNEDFIYAEQQWGKYLTFEIPSTYEISRQRTTTNLPLDNTINSNLSNLGISLETPIIFDFSWVISRQNILGTESFFISNINTKSIANQPEYQTLGVQIIESVDGDYFEIFGTYNQSNESLDDWIDEMTNKGRKMKIEYHVSLFEENILTTQQVFSVNENFSKKILYRPIIIFSNTVAAIDIEMKVIDLFDNSQIIRKASIGLKSNIFKYGRTLSKINIDNAYKPKIYNQKVLNSSGGIISQSVPDINLTKVNFPVIVDRVKILTSSIPSNDEDYKSMGLSEIILNPFGNILKFSIAISDVDGNAVPYDLTKITENSTITLSFKDDSNFLEKNIWQQSDENNFDLGTVIYRIEEEDLPTIQNISKNNNNFYLTIKSEDAGIRTMLYSGKFVFFNRLTFLNSSNNIDDKNYNDFIDKTKLKDLTQPFSLASRTISNKNLFVFLKPTANVKEFEKFLSVINADIHFKQAGGNQINLTYMYFILNLPQSTISEIQKKSDILKTYEIDFCLGKGRKSSILNIDKINNNVINFNCASKIIKT